MRINAKVISIGDELLIGQIINSNSSFIAEKLYSAGIPVKRIVTIGDTEKELLDELTDSLKNFNVTVITGGLGPTHDDITKPVLMKFFKDKPVLNKKVLNKVKSLFKSRNQVMPEVNTGQAMIPSKSEVIWNDNGTAPGIWINNNNKIFIALPGVPYEMKPMITEIVLPKLSNLFKNKNEYTFLSKTILTTGISESDLYEKLGDINEIIGKHKLAFLPSAELVKLRIDVTAKSKKEALLSYKKIEKKILDKAGNFVFGYEDDKLEKVLGELLKKKKKTLAVAESCTGGLISAKIVDIPGSSDYFLGGVCAYANDAKKKLLDVKNNSLKKFGAVSEQVAIEMAEGVRKKFKSDYAISTTGIAGPTGGSKVKPVGLVYIGFSDKNKSYALKFNLGDTRMKVITRATISALNLLRKEVLKNNS
ncbi:MAG TPA: competence/damage-inducible protein A [Bacteroidetes bacterium]|nr:competence/damage-inducible protein A [Bacteroidota bacterium]